MTKTKRLTILLCLALCCILLLAACGGGGGKSSSAPAGQGSAPLVFVAADQTNWDKALGIGDYSYYISLVLNDDGTAVLNATCAGAGATGEPDSREDFSANDFSKSGAWTKEEGYGYEITLDGYTTKTDYDKASARQYIYIVIDNGGATSGLVQLMAKDTSFRTEIAEDYDIFEARDAYLTFSATGNSGNGNATQTKVYLEKDGSANALVQMGASPSYTRGTWTENADKSLTVDLNGAKLASYCGDPGREGYRLTYNGSTMYASVSGEEIAYTDEDFDGKTVRTLSCGERDFTVELTEKGAAKIVNSSGASVAIGAYTEDGGTLTVVIDGVTYVSDGDGNITLSFTVASSGGGPFGGSTTYERSFPIDGSEPPAVSSSGEASGETASAEADASGEAASDEAASAEPEA